ncbi:energy transducer TonB [Parabacteroides sp. TM07-1AC]|uniref:energy transducer TonB n=1 Tax=Parabacteroides sp. TM07-1AC TaxID=2292363 RepID=UPI000F00F62A|nr:energy transducer TonB [Parabacteroides sp. TM07-1AC]RHU30644.1 energy transducer TonB [Parabacteroides sp. TM07-1AC]
MKATPILFLLLAVFASGISGVKAQQNSLPEEQLHLRQEVRPYLDSLIIEEPKPDDTDISRFRLEAVFPVNKLTRFGTNEGEFTAFTPDNPKLKGLVTEPVPLLGGARISLIYSFVDDYENAVPIAWKYRFESVRQKGESGEEMACQSLYLHVLNDLRFSRIKVGLMDVVLLPPDNDGKQINNVPKLGYRSMSFSRANDDQYMLTYLLKTNEGVYSPIDRSEGSDRTFPEYIGGSSAQFWFIRQNMEYPEKAREEEVSGTVLISCTVEPDGSVTDPHVFLGSEPLLNDEAIRLVGLTSGKWIPATRNGENIADEKVIPVTFDLNDDGIKIVEHTKKSGKKLPLKAYLFFGAIAVAVILYLRSKFRKKNRKPDPALRPNISVSNDKIVIVAGVEEADVEQMLRVFTDIYNSRRYDAIIRIHPMGKQVFALTFPYDISWEVFIELMDHLVYFDDNEHKVQIRAWLTLPKECEPVAGQHVMLFFQEDDKDFEPLYISTQYNRIWKIDYETNTLKEAEAGEEYAKPPFAYNEIVQVNFIEID